MRGESDDIIESFIVYINNLQDITSLSTKKGRILDNEELFFLRGPQHPPCGREGRTSGDGATAYFGYGVNGLDDLGELLWVGLGLEAAFLVADEGEEVVLG